MPYAYASLRCASFVFLITVFCFDLGLLLLFSCVSLADPQYEVCCTEEVIARLISPDIPAPAKRAVLCMLRDIGQGSTSGHLYGPVASQKLATWDVRVYVAESAGWCVLWELAVGFSERKLWSSEMYQAGLKGDNYAGLKGDNYYANGYMPPVPPTLMVRVWSIGTSAEVKGALGVAAVERLRKSHLRGSQSKVHISRGHYPNL